MKTYLQSIFLISIFGIQNFYGQNIADFTSVTPVAPTSEFVIPSTHTFQVFAEVGDALTEGGTFKIMPDFTGYIPIAGSSTNGYLSINSEATQFNGGGGVMVFDINYNATTKLWETTASEDLDFSGVGGTAANCSGTITAWGTVVTCEEATLPDTFPPFNGYNDVGWNIEIDPATKTVVNNQKLWAMGNFKHENVTIHSNSRTVYQGADSNPGYLYKYVADVAEDLSSGKLYVYTGSKNGSGSWVQLNNSNQAEQNSTLTQSAGAGATVFNGIEDVEIGPDGMVYFAVKGEGAVYRFSDSDVLETAASTVAMETFVGGGASYDVNDGTNTISVAWGNGNDNLAFDGNGNLWVLQDNGNSYIWVVKSGHTQAAPDVEIFGITPAGAEPTGITFTPDYKYLFLSIQHPNNTNTANQTDAAGNIYDFEKGTTLVVALNENLGSSLSVDVNGFDSEFEFYPNPVNLSQKLRIKGDNNIRSVGLYTVQGKKVLVNDYDNLSEVDLNLQKMNIGMYLLKVNDKQVAKLIVR